ncbi:MAG: hypothetical protein PSY14_03490 [bacterium]|nr:hypothetical protein [bacterium]
MKKTILVLALSALMFISPAWAHGDEHEQHHQAAAPAATDDLQTLKDGYAALQAAAGEKAFGKIHEIVEGMEPALKSIGKTHKEEAGIAGTSTLLEKILHDLHESGDAKDVDAVTSELKKFDGGLQLLQSRLKAAPAGHEQHTDASSPSKMSGVLTIASPEKIVPGKDNILTVSLTDKSGAPLTLDKLKEVHTRKVHLLVADETLEDYHHIHPVEGKSAGTYTASFVPRKATSYKVWADITPIGGEQQFVSSVIKGEAPCASLCIEKSVSLKSSSGGMTAQLSFDGEISAGAAVMGTLSVQDESGKSIADLQPVMGAFAHIVGFYEDFDTIAHIHPMGEEPTSEEQRGGPMLKFHIEPKKKGFLKLYAQIRRDGKEVFFPFGVLVK